MSLRQECHGVRVLLSQEYNRNRESPGQGRHLVRVSVNLSCLRDGGAIKSPGTCESGVSLKQECF